MTVVDWLRDHESTLGLLVALLLAYVVLNHTVPIAVRGALTRGRLLPDDSRRRAETLALVASRTVLVIILVAAVIYILDGFGLSIAPVITGVGITGIAIGFGAQSLVRDALNGIFILAENQYAHGDTVTVAGVFGTVEDVNLRRTVLRDPDGTLHSIPNGAITVTSNHSRDFSRARVQVVLAHGQDLDGARSAIEEAGRTLAGEARDLLSEPPRFARVLLVDATGVTVEVEAQTAPGRQWEAAGLLRERLPAMLRDAGVRLAYGDQGVGQ